jgi:hypothetical protein
LSRLDPRKLVKIKILLELSEFLLEFGATILASFEDLQVVSDVGENTPECQAIFTDELGNSKLSIIAELIGEAD